jgi:DNA polymerase-3 subunit beta
MKLNTTAGTLHASAKLAATAANDNSALPAYSLMLLSEQDGVLRMECANSEMGVALKSHIPCDPFSAMCVPANRMVAMLAGIPADTEIVFSVTDKGASIKYSNGSAKLPVCSPDGFVRMKVRADEFLFECQSTDIVSMLSAVSFCAATNNLAHPVANGVSVEGESDSSCLTAVGCDMHRMAIVETQVDQCGDFSFILPKNTCSNLIGMLSQNPGDVIVSGSDSVACFGVDGPFGEQSRMEIFTRMIGGDYLPYRKVLGYQHTDEVTIDKKTLLGAIARMDSSASKITHMCLVSFNEGKMTMMSEDLDEQVEAVEAIPVAFKGSRSFGVNLKLFRECVKNMPVDEIVIGIPDTVKSPIRLMYNGVLRIQLMPVLASK